MITGSKQLPSTPTPTPRKSAQLQTNLVTTKSNHHSCGLLALPNDTVFCN